MLPLRDILSLKLTGVRLAVLSACERGIPGATLPDEVVSLPTGLLQAGVAGIAASLWSVADSSTMWLLTRFYHLWRNQGLQPSEALRQAQIWLRDTTEGEKCQDLPDSFILTPGDRLYTHPFHWAAFCYSGV